MLDFKETAKECFEIAALRAAKDKHYDMEQNIKNLAGEVVELEEAITLLKKAMTELDTLANPTADVCTNELETLVKIADLKEAAEDELADVVIYSLLIAEYYDLALETAVIRKTNINRARANKKED